MSIKAESAWRRGSVGTEDGEPMNDINNCEIIWTNRGQTMTQQRRDREKGSAYPITVNRLGMLCKTLHRADALDLHARIGRSRAELYQDVHLRLLRYLPAQVRIRREMLVEQP